MQPGYIMRRVFDDTLDLWVGSRYTLLNKTSVYKENILKYPSNLQARTVEKSELLGASEKAQEQSVESFRLANASLDGPSITLSYMADDKSHVRKSITFF